MIPRISIVLFVFLAGCSFLNGPSQTEINELKARIERENVGKIVREIYQDGEFRPLWISRGRTTERLQRFFQLADDTSHGVHTNVERLRTPSSNLIQYDIDVTTALVKHATALARKDADIKDAIEDAIAASAMFHITDRLSDAFDFALPDEAGFAADAKVLLKRGYQMPPPAFWLSG